MVLKLIARRDVRVYVSQKGKLVHHVAGSMEAQEIDRTGFVSLRPGETIEVTAFHGVDPSCLPGEPVTAELVPYRSGEISSAFRELIDVVEEPPY
jgi:hypothetical protein